MVSKTSDIFTGQLTMKYFFAIICITAAWIAGAVEVFNFGVPGLTINGVSGRRLKQIIAAKPDVAVVMLGREEMCNPRRLRTVEEFRKDYESMLAIFKRARIPLILINVRPATRNYQTGTAEKIVQANAVIAELAAKNKIPLIDLHTMVMNAKNNAPAEYLRSKHFSAGDSMFLARYTAAVIKEKFPAAKKIACIGGEAVHGYRLAGAGTSKGETFPAQLALRLNGISATAMLPQDLPPLPGSFVSKARWLWYPESFLNRRNVERVFRKKFVLDTAPSSAEFFCSGDDQAEVYINGKLAAANDWKKGANGNAAPLLHKGTNVIAVKVLNVAVDGGMIFRMDIKLPGNKTVEIVSDKSWRSFIPAAGCLMPDFDENNGEEPWIVGDAGAFPWGRIPGFQYEKFLSDAEKAEKKRLQELERKNFELIRQKLSKEPRRNYQVRYIGNRGTIFDGKTNFPAMIFHAANFAPQDYRSMIYAKTMYDAGFKLFNLAFQLERLWQADGSINFKYIDDQFGKLLTVAPDARIFVGIGMNSPEWYVKQNLSEVVGYSRDGTPPAFNAKDQQRALRMSYASEKWRKDTARVLTQIIDYLEKSPFAPRIFAYAPHGGVYNTEWHYFGMRNDMPDNGAVMTAKFRDFLRKRYKTDADLQKAWKNAKVTLSTAQVPGVKERTSRSYGALRVNSDSPAVIDYLLCHQQVVADTILYFNKAAKEACNKRALVGNYCGYFFEMNFPAEGWHLENVRILDSEYTDFQISPYGYGDYRVFGASGAARGVPTSYRLRNKLLIYEDDSRTHLNTVSGGHYANTPRESAGIIMRGFGVSLTTGCAYWLLEFNRGWYEDAILKEALKKMQEIRNLPLKGGSVAKAALVCDFDSVIYHTYSDNKVPTLNKSLLDRTILELGECAVPFDVVIPEDIGKPGLPDYQLYIFSNMLKFTPKNAALVKKLQSSGKSILWLYAPGVINNGEISTESVEKLTGFKVKMLNNRNDIVTEIPGGKMPGITQTHKVLPRRRYELKDVPVFAIKDPQAEILGTAKINGKTEATLGVKKHTKGFSMLHTVPRVDRKMLGAALEMAGIHTFLKNPAKGDVIFVDRSFLVLHNVSGGRKEFSLPHPAKVTMHYPAKQVISAKPVNSFTFNAEPKSTTIFSIE